MRRAHAHAYSSGVISTDLHAGELSLEAPANLDGISSPLPLVHEAPPMDQPIPTESAEELLCVVAFIRHGDRTPKQKLKFHTSEPSLLAMIEEDGGSAHEVGDRDPHHVTNSHALPPTASPPDTTPQRSRSATTIHRAPPTLTDHRPPTHRSRRPSRRLQERKIKTARQMEQLLVRVEAIVERLQAEALQSGDLEAHGIDSMLSKFTAVRQVGAMHGHARDRATTHAQPQLAAHATHVHMRCSTQVLTAHPFHGINRKVQIKPTAWAEVDAPVDSAGSKSRGPSSAASPREPGPTTRRREEIGGSPHHSPERDHAGNEMEVIKGAKDAGPAGSAARRPRRTVAT